MKTKKNKKESIQTKQERAFDAFIAMSEQLIRSEVDEISLLNQKINNQDAKIDSIIELLKNQNSNNN